MNIGLTGELNFFYNIISRPNVNIALKDLSNNPISKQSQGGKIRYFPELSFFAEDQYSLSQSRELQYGLV